MDTEKEFQGAEQENVNLPTQVLEVPAQSEGNTPHRLNRIRRKAHRKSVLAPGQAAQMAGWIQAKTGGGLFSIITVDPYSSDYDECLNRATYEKADNARPALSGSVENMDEYDVVFLGYPDWWSTCSMAVFTFLDGYDFTGKIVISFCANAKKITQAKTMTPPK